MPSTTATIKHRTQISGTNNPGVQISKNPWNDSELVAGGATGGVFVRDDAQTDKWGLIDAVATGQVMTSAGTSTLPAWSASPSVTSVAASSFIAIGSTPATAGAARITNNTGIDYRNSGNTADVQMVLLDSSNNALFGSTGVNGPSATGLAAGGSNPTFGVNGASATALFSWTLNNAGHVLVQNDNSWDIGASGANRPRSAFFGTSVNIGTNPAAAGDVRLAASGAINRRNNANGADLALISRVTTDEVALGDAGGNTRLRSVMAQPTSLANGDWWLESNTGAVTGASGALMSRLNGATVLVSPALRAKGRATAQTGANASVSTFTNGAADASFVVSANVLVTTATNHNFTVTCAYTDEGNTARTLTLTFGLVAGGVATTAVANANGAVPYHGVPVHIRCKASTAITIATTGTFTTVAYNVEGIIQQVA